MRRLPLVARATNVASRRSFASFAWAPNDFAADEPVRLDLFVKNVPNLLVKVFEVNTFNFYRTQQREVDTDINLDGLVPNAEETHAYAEPPLRRGCCRGPGRPVPGVPRAAGTRDAVVVSALAGGAASSA